MNGSVPGFDPVGQDILVRVDGLFDLGDGPDYNLIGFNTAHPDNHYGTGAANISHRNIAADYRAEFYGGNAMPEAEKLHYNDTSLTTGGKFDLKKEGVSAPDWTNTGSHDEHREGINTDVRCCSGPGTVPRSRWVRLNEIFELHGSTRTKDETNTRYPHWHLRFEYGSPQRAQVTPHSYVEDAFDAALLRESSQSEYENWYGRLTLAKASGQEPLLTESKVMQNSVFASSEYAARHRTRPQFVEDVFMTHLRRLPTADESYMWVSYMASLPPANTERRRQQRLLWEIQALPEFRDVVYAIVDPTFSQ